MQSTGLWSLDNDLMASVGLSHACNFPKIHPHLHMRNSVRVHPYAHPQHIKVLKHFIQDRDVGCNLRGFGASTMTLRHHSDSAIPPIFLKSTPTSRGVSR